MHVYNNFNLIWVVYRLRNESLVCLADMIASIIQLTGAGHCVGHLQMELLSLHFPSGDNLLRLTNELMTIFRCHLGLSDCGNFISLWHWHFEMCCCYSFSNLRDIYE